MPHGLPAAMILDGLLMPAPLMMPSVYVEHFTTWCGGHGDYDGKHGGLHGTGRVSLLRIIVLRHKIANGNWVSPPPPPEKHWASLTCRLVQLKPRPVQLLTRTPGQDKQPRADLPGRKRLGGVIPSGPTAAGVSITRGFSLMGRRTANLFGFPTHRLCHLERGLVQHSISQMTIRNLAAATARTVANGRLGSSRMSQNYRPLIWKSWLSLPPPRPPGWPRAQRERLNQIRNCVVRRRFRSPLFQTPTVYVDKATYFGKEKITPFKDGVVLQCLPKRLCAFCQKGRKRISHLEWARQDGCGMAGLLDSRHDLPNINKPLQEQATTSQRSKAH
ncbi:hypothetical protein MCOR34_008493 [Pyricularia oryzae]|nr:hypothetical protein MCOR34_008493 [Pyricularia oryzae]